MNLYTYAKERLLPTKSALIGIGLVVGATVCYAVIRLVTPAPETETVYLPSESVTVYEDSQATLDALAASRTENRGLRIDKGQLRDEKGRLLLAIETLEARNAPGQPADPGATDAVLNALCDERAAAAGTGPEQPPPLPDFKSLLTASKFKGIDQADDRLKFAWTGNVKVWMGPPGLPDDAPGWALVHDRDFDRENTVALTSEPPEPPPHRKPWYVGIQWALSTDRPSIDNIYSPIGNISRARVYGGRTLFSRKRVSIGVGLYVDPQSAGTDLRFQF